MSLSKKEYTSHYLMTESRFAVIPFFVPMVALILASESSLSFMMSLILVLVSQVCSLALLKTSAPFTSLFFGNELFRNLFFLIYTLFVCLPLALIALVPINALAQLISPILFALGFIVSMFFHSYWFEAGKLEPLGWYTKEKVVEEPLGSPLGNKIAVVLAVLIFLGIISLFIAG